MALIATLCLILNMVLVRLMLTCSSVLRLCCACGPGFWESFLLLLLKNEPTRLLNRPLVLKLVVLLLAVFVCGLRFRLHTRCPCGLERILQVVAMLPNPLRASVLGPILGRNLCVNPWHVCPTLLGAVLWDILRARQQLVVTAPSIGLELGLGNVLSCVSNLRRLGSLHVLG